MNLLKSMKILLFDLVRYAIRVSAKRGIMKATISRLRCGEKTAFVGRAALISPHQVMSREGYMNITGRKEQLYVARNDRSFRL
jgi:hypothetical protein